MGNKSTGMSFLGTLGLIFIVLKLVNVIDWPWWIVLAPYWVGLLIALMIMLFIWLDLWMHRWW